MTMRQCPRSSEEIAAHSATGTSTHSSAGCWAGNHWQPATNAAFAKVPKATLTALGKNPAALKRVLLYHVVAGKVTAAKVVKLRSAKTLAGPSVRVRVTGSTVRIDTARVTTADAKASNGVVHLIDRVLIPPAA